MFKVALIETVWEILKTSKRFGREIANTSMNFELLIIRLWKIIDQFNLHVRCENVKS